MLSCQPDTFRADIGRLAGRGRGTDLRQPRVDERKLFRQRGGRVGGGCPRGQGGIAQFRACVIVDLAVERAVDAVQIAFDLHQLRRGRADGLGLRLYQRRGQARQQRDPAAQQEDERTTPHHATRPRRSMRAGR